MVLLIEPRLELAYRTGWRVYDQIPAALKFQTHGSLDAHSDERRVGMGREDEVVFQAPIVAIERRVDSRIEIVPDQALVARQIADPFRLVAADEIRDGLSGWLSRFPGCVAIGAGPFEAQLAQEHRI